MKAMTVILAALAASVTAASAFAEPDIKGCEGTLRDDCWMWGHDSGVYDKPGNAYNIPVSEPISMADACKYMGIPNVCAVTWKDPDEAYLSEFSRLRRFSWVTCGGGERNWRILADRCFRIADRMPNMVGLDLDDYFISKECETVPTSNGVVRVIKSVVGYENTMGLKARVKAYKRPLELRMVVYLENPEMPDYAPIMREMDTIFLWTWGGVNLTNMTANIARFREAAPKTRALLGVYMWDFGGCKPLEIGLMRHQLAVGLDLYKKHQIDGFIFHCTPLVNKSPKIEAVEYARDWIRRNGDLRR